MRCVPLLNGKYWIALIGASIFGTNTGDFVSDYLGFGHLRGIPILLALLAAIFVAEKIVPWKSVAWFWAAIITVRTFATNVADSFFDHGIPYNRSIPIVAALLLIAVIVQIARKSPRADADRPARADAQYWLSMSLAGILGTLCGDYTSFARHMGTFDSTLLWSAGVMIMFVIWRPAKLGPALLYWATVVLIRSAGTAAGDHVAETLGLGAATALTGVLFVGLIAMIYGVRQEKLVGGVSAAAER